MDVEIRRLRAEDIEQVIEIEREAFAPLWLGTAYKRDLNNRFARYLVAYHPEYELDAEPDEDCGAAEADENGPDSSENPAENPGDASLWGRMVRSVKGIVGKQAIAAKARPEDIAGYVGMWFQGETKPTLPRLRSGRSCGATASASCC